MNNIFGLLRLLSVNLCISSIHSPSIEPPLIFNPETLEIYTDWKSAPDKGPYVVACPAKQDNEKQFDQQGSLDHKSLFVQHYSQQKTDFIRSITCDEYVKLAVAIRTEPKSKDKFVEFGYEVYIDTGKFIQYFKQSDFGQFDSLLPPSSMAKRIVNFVINLGSDDHRNIVEDNTDDIYDGSTKRYLNFVWLPKVVMKYDLSTWDVQSMTYFTTKNSRQLWAHCDDHDLGSQFYGEEGLEQYYSTDNQSKVFNGVTLPTNELRHGGVCKFEKYCLTPYTLLWPYQFQSSPLNPTSCSDLPKIPVWHETAEDLLDYLEQFLVTVAEVTNQRLKIITGTYETLTFPIQNINKRQKMYLAKKKIPIPKIIYKIVKYKTHDCDAEKELCWFDVVVVIHNQPAVQGEVLCEDKSLEWGWQNIQYMSTRTTKRDPSEKSEFIYVCNLDEAMQKKLGYKNDTTVRKYLNLTYFPVYDEDKHEIGFKNWRQKFEDKMYELFGK